MLVDDKLQNILKFVARKDIWKRNIWIELECEE